VTFASSAVRPIRLQLGALLGGATSSVVAAALCCAGRDDPACFPL
jgi:hypothetical protein